MNKPQTINGIYFDEVSDTVDDWLTTYLNFNNVDLVIKPSSSAIVLILKYRGRGSYLLENNVHVSTQLNYGWYVSLLGSKSLSDEGETHYKDVSVVIRKNIFNVRKITIQFNNEKSKGLVLYGKKVLLTSLVLDDNLSPSSSQIHIKNEQGKKNTQKRLNTHSLLTIVFELFLIAVVSYIVHRFIYGEITLVQAVFIYGLIGLLAYVNDLVKKIEHIVVLLLTVAFFSKLPYEGFAFAMICLYFIFFRRKGVPVRTSTNILTSPKAKERLLVFLRKIGQIPPEKSL